jgi:hypothetical protein
MQSQLVSKEKIILVYKSASIRNWLRD